MRHRLHFLIQHFCPANNVKDPTTEGTGLGGTGSVLEMANTFIKKARTVQKITCTLSAGNWIIL